jgi:hypothetical protein
MFVGIMSNELRDHILDNIDSLDTFIDVIIEKNKLELDTRKSLFTKDARRIAGELITSYFENEFFDALEDAMIEEYDNKYEVKENNDEDKK